jgi:hypothetical protein
MSESCEFLSGNHLMFHKSCGTRSASDGEDGGESDPIALVIG